MSMFPFPAILALWASVRLSEIQASPPAGLPEFIELSGPPGTRLRGWSLGDGSSRRPLPDGATLPASGILVVSSDCRAIREAWAGVDIPCSQSASWARLSVEADLVVLRDSLGNVADSVQWSSRNWGEWPRGRSRERISFCGAGSDPDCWRISRAIQGATPGWIESTEDAVAEGFVFEPVRRAVHPGGRNPLGVRASASVRVEIFDLARRSLGAVFEGEPPATGAIEWDGKIGGRNLTPGVYLLLATCGPQSRRAWIAVGKP